MDLTLSPNVSLSIKVARCYRNDPNLGQCKNYTTTQLPCCLVHWCADCCAKITHFNCAPEWLQERNQWAIATKTNDKWKVINVKTDEIHITYSRNVPPQPPIAPPPPEPVPSSPFPEYSLFPGPEIHQSNPVSLDDDDADTDAAGFDFDPENREFLSFLQEPWELINNPAHPASHSQHD